MKKTVALFLLLCTLAFILSSCAINPLLNPGLEEWHIKSARNDEGFLDNDYVKNTVYIKFNSNDRVIFKPVNSDCEMVGTFTYDFHENFEIAFENGEKTQNGNLNYFYSLADFGSCEGSLIFEFRGIMYFFYFE